jgi:hypothetical protein
VDSWRAVQTAARLQEIDNVIQPRLLAMIARHAQANPSGAPAQRGGALSPAVGLVNEVRDAVTGWPTKPEQM